jgi:repressor LexA
MPNKETFLLKVKGDSMVNKGILHEDMVLVEVTPVVSDGDMAVVLLEDGATVKTYYKEKDQIRLQPEHDYMEPILVKDVLVLGKVIGVFRFL